MAKKDDWYRSSTWDIDSQKEFNLKIKRARKGFNRAQYFWLKAGSLFYSKDSDLKKKYAALKLLERALTESGDINQDIEGHIYEQAGRYNLILKHYKKGITYLEKCMELTGIKKRKFHYLIPPEILLARCYIKNGDYNKAKKMFMLYYNWKKQNGYKLKDYSELEKLTYFNADGKACNNPREAAESIIIYHHIAEDNEPAVPGIMKMNYDSLKALDNHFRIQEENGLKKPFMPRTNYKQEFLQRHFLPELGSYIGCVCISAKKAEWKINNPLMCSRLIAGDMEFNPFFAAYETIFYEMPLMLLVDKISGIKR